MKWNWSTLRAIPEWYCYAHVYSYSHAHVGLSLVHSSVDQYLYIDILHAYNYINAKYKRDTDTNDTTDKHDDKDNAKNDDANYSDLANNGGSVL